MSPFGELFDWTLVMLLSAMFASGEVELRFNEGVQLTCRPRG
jgi:hypothetical protein